MRKSFYTDEMGYKVEKYDDGYRAFSYSTDRLTELDRIGKVNFSNQSKEMISHPLINRRVYNTSNGDIYTIKKIRKNWFFGWYFSAYAIKQNGEKNIVFLLIENLGCGLSYVEDAVNSFNEFFEVLE